MIFTPFAYRKPKVVTEQIDADATAFLTAAGITDPTISSAINTLVIDLKGYGLWSKMKAIYPFVGGTSSTHKWNLKDPRDLDAAFRLTFYGGLTHASTGITGNGSTGYYDTYIDWSTDTSQNDVSMHVYQTNTVQEDKVDIGALRSTPFIGLQLGTRNNSNFFRFRVNSNETRADITNTDAKGFYGVSRLNSTTIVGSKNTTQTSFARTSITPPSYNIYGMCMNTNGSGDFFSAHNHAYTSIGQGLTDTELDNYYTAVQAFQTTLGRNV